jgi:hypothetical protein
MDTIWIFRDEQVLTMIGKGKGSVYVVNEKKVNTKTFR